VYIKLIKIFIKEKIYIIINKNQKEKLPDSFYCGWNMVLFCKIRFIIFTG